MNDEMFYELRPPIRDEFRRRFRNLVSETINTSRRSSIFAIQLSFKQVAILAFIAIVAACAGVVLSTDFTVAEDSGWLTIYESNYRLVPASMIESVQSAPSSTASTQMQDGIGESPQDIDGLLADLSFEPSLPSFLPEGYSLDHSYPITQPGLECFSMIYRRASHPDASIRYSACHVDWDESSSEITVAPGTWQKLHVNGMSGILLEGFWQDYAAVSLSSSDDFAKVYWDSDRGYTLHWKGDNVHYSLQTFDEQVTEEQIVRMAESVSPNPR